MAMTYMFNSLASRSNNKPLAGLWQSRALHLDYASRVAFPAAFVAFMAWYWIKYTGQEIVDMNEVQLADTRAYNDRKYFF